MKGYKYLARKFAENWTKPRLSNEEVDALAHAYETGFMKAREIAKGLIESFGDPKKQGMALLMGVIGQAEVDPETGRPECLDEEHSPNGDESK